MGWLGGWLGSFLWLPCLAVVLCWQGRWRQGLTGLALGVLAAGVVAATCPWRSPDTRYWRLLLGPYLLVVLAVSWAVWAYGGPRAAGLNWWNLLWLLPLFLPVLSLGGKTWNDGAVGRRSGHGQ